MSDLCKKLQIDKVQTSPYHPQTNGCLETWHGTLNNMIKKCMTCKLIGQGKSNMCSLLTVVLPIPTQVYLLFRLYMDGICVVH